jgi:hypothetical protein
VSASRANRARVENGYRLQLVSERRRVYDFCESLVMDEHSEDMKLRETVALALVGWSLMLPPSSHTLRMDMTQDLSKWNVHSTHATAAQCEQEKQRLQDRVTEPATDVPKSTLRRPGRDLLAARYRHARCVSSDDPALKAQ